MGRPRDAYRGSVLTTRMAEILRLVANGYQAKDIAVEFGTSWRTVETQLAEIRMRLHARTVGHAVARGFHLGILQIEPLDEAAG